MTVELLADKPTDEQFAEEAILSAAQAGVYIEVGQVYDTQTGQPTYYAMTISTKQHQQLLEETLARLVAENEANFRSAKDFEGTNPPPMHITRPLTCLLHQDFVAQPTYVEGFPTRQAAIEASIQAYCSQS